MRLTKSARSNKDANSEEAGRRKTKHLLGSVQRNSDSDVTGFLFSNGKFE